MSAVKRLLVVTHVPHFRHDGAICAYGPYVRELDIWCDLFAEVVIAAPCYDAQPEDDGLASSRDNLSIYPIPASGGDTLAAKLWQLCLLPWIVLRLCFAMWRSDAIHVRCPGNLGLLGVILGPLFSDKLVAKYAGQWNGFPGESWTVRLQRRLLKSRWWRGITTVYGEWPDQPDHVIPFFTSIMTPQQIDRAKQIAETHPQPDTPFSLLFVGRLSKQKNVDVLIEALARLVAQGLDLNCIVVGSGAELESLQRLARQLNVDERVRFVGGIEFDQVFDYYERSHALVLASETEGWPKAIAEAMACGIVCIGSDRGLVPWMLSEGRGFVVTPRDVNQLSDVIRNIVASPQLRDETSRRAALFGQQYSLHTLRDSLAKLLSQRWGVEIEAEDRSMDTTIVTKTEKPGDLLASEGAVSS